MTKLESRILKVLSGKKLGLNAGEMAKKLGIPKSRRREMKLAVESLLADGQLVSRKGRVALAQQGKAAEGEVVKVTGTFGFVRTDLGDKDIFVPGRHLKGAMPGDRVSLRITNGKSELPEGKVQEILAPDDSPFSGILSLEENQCLVLPDRMKFPLHVDPEQFNNAKHGDKVLVRLVYRGERHSEHIAAIVEAFGSADSAQACCGAILAENGVYAEFSAEAIEQARALSAGFGIHPKELAARLDLREQEIFTIDGADTKDIDDAISLNKTEKGWELGVHIADVSHYVTAKSPLDQEAYARGTSVYYADSVVPMLPPELSNGICSLNPQEDRLAFSALVQLDDQGKMQGYRFAKTVIRSRVKGVYSEINAIFAGEADAELLEKYRGQLPALEQMRQLAALLTRNRYTRGAMNLESVESKITVGDDGRVIDVKPRSRGESEFVIEEFMLVANEAAASYALERDLPFLFRVHETPAPDKLEQLYSMLDRLGIKFRRPKSATADSAFLSGILEQVGDMEIRPVINNLILRSMAKAQYSHQNIGHYGLALENYSHFTSPIRRYPDLVIHRILSSMLSGAKPQNLKNRFTTFVADAARQSTNRELAAVSAERDCEDCYKAEYMSKFIGEEYDGVITSTTAFGIYVQLENTVEGLVRIEAFPPGDWSFDNVAEWKSNRGGSLRLGDKMRVRVLAANIGAGQVDFAVAKSIIAAGK